jgi:hypothetical protein
MSTAPLLHIIEAPPLQIRSVLLIGGMVRIESPHPMPGWWRRFWYWALLGWKWKVL